MEVTTRVISMTTPVLVLGGVGILIALVWVGALIGKYKGYKSIPGFFKAATLAMLVGSVGLVLVAPYAQVIQVVEKLSSSGD